MGIDTIDVHRPLSYSHYHSYNRYELPRPNDNWSYGSYHSGKKQKYKRQTKNPQRDRDVNGRPRPLQLENEKYYDLVFPRSRHSDGMDYRYVYQPDSLDHAEL